MDTELEKLEYQMFQAHVRLTKASDEFLDALSAVMRHRRIYPKSEHLQRRNQRIGEAFTNIAIDLQQQSRSVESLTLEELQQLFQDCFAISKE
jgi:uncharacterized protein YabN with tetrapyrrole methylase and pyrophosphatase domain